MFLLRIGIKEVLIVIDLVKIEDGLFALCGFPIFWYFCHLFVAVGDHPDELGSQVVNAIGRIENADGLPLGARFGEFRKGLLNPTCVSCAAFLNPAGTLGRK